MQPCAAILRMHPEFRDDVRGQCPRCLSSDKGDEEDCLARLILRLTGRDESQ